MDRQADRLHQGELEVYKLMGRNFMAHIRKGERHRQLSDGLSLHAKMFVFFDRSTGARRFEIKADAHGRIPIDEAASLLAVHCIARRQVPGDFGMLVGIGEDLIDGLVGRATRLIESCAVPAAPVSPIPLTRRQNEVLVGILQTLTNKEIASRLNVSERTVKFHVSALLEKFHVRRRVGLLMGAEGCLLEVVQKTETKSRAPFLEERRMPPALLSQSVTATPPMVMARGSRG